MAHQLPNGKWRVLIRRAGYTTVDEIFPDQRAAEDFEVEKIADIKGARALWSKSMTLAETARQYLRSALFSSKTAHTQATERTRLKPVLEALGEFSLEHLENGQRIAAFRDHRVNRVSQKTKKKVKPDSVRLELAALSAVLNWALEGRIIERNPLIGMSRPRGRARDRRMFKSEEVRLTATLFADEQRPTVVEAARFVVIQRELGCRPGELAALRRADVDIESRAARFRDTKHDHEDRIVHLTSNAATAISSQLAYGQGAAPDSPFLFTSFTRNGNVPTPANYRHFITLLREADIVLKDFHAHAGRREWVSTAFENGLSHADVMRTTGHRSYAAVQAYNKSQNLHPEVRRRLDEEANKRKASLLEAFADEYDLTAEELKKFFEGTRMFEKKIDPFTRAEKSRTQADTSRAKTRTRKAGSAKRAVKQDRTVANSSRSARPRR